MENTQIVSGDFSTDSLNNFNQLFYKRAERNLVENLPNLFTKLDLFNKALFFYITKSIPKGNIKLKELGSGSKIDRWEVFGEQNKEKKWEITLTDISDDLLHDLTKFKKDKNFDFRKEIYNLFDNFEKLYYKDRFDVLLSTYTFDSVWLPSDIHLEKMKGDWYKALYKVSIPDIKNPEKPLKSVFFKKVKIVKKFEKTDINKMKYGNFVNNYFKSEDEVSVNLAGGLINKVIDAFDHQLVKGGMFITADIAVINKKERSNGFKSVSKIAKIKIDDYALVKYILDKLGYKAKLYNLHDFIKHNGILTPVAIFDHFVLIVSKK